MLRWPIRQQDWPVQPSRRAERSATVARPPERAMSSITSQRHGHLAHLTLNRPETGNRFTMEMFRSLGSALTEADRDPQVRCTLLTANGEHFAVGVDPLDVLP